MDVQHLNARDDENVKPKISHERWCDDWVYISAHSLLLLTGYYLRALFLRRLRWTHIRKVMCLGPTMCQLKTSISGMTQCISATLGVLD
jgi:hypothetical protein